MSIRHSIVTSVFLGLLCLAALSASAATVTWDGNGNSDNGGSWNVAANWDTDALPGPGDTAVLPHTGTTRQITVDAPVTVDTLNFAQNSWTNWGTAGPTILLNAALTVRDWNGPNWSNQYCNVNVNGQTLTLGQQDTFGDFVHLSGGGTVVKNTSGFLYLANDDGTGFTGQWQINEGTVGVYYSNAMATPSSVIVASGATLASHSAALSAPMTLNGTGQGGQGALNLGYAGWSNTYAAPITLASDSSVQIAGNLTFAGAIGGSGGMTKFGAGTLTLTTAENYSGETVVQAGTLELSGGPSVMLANSHVTVKSGAILSGAAAKFPMGVTVEPGGTWLSGGTPGWWYGNGDPNNSGNWSDPANWGGNVVPSGTATLGSVTAIGNSGTIYRNVTVDVPTTLDHLEMVQDSNSFGNWLTLGADLTVNSYGFSGAWAKSNSNINTNGHTLSIGSAPTFGDFPTLSGGGRIIKTGTGSVNLGNSGGSGFTGDWVINGGSLDYVWLDGRNANSLTINSGGQATVANGTVSGLPKAIVLHGGSLVFYNGNYSYSSPITLATDSTINTSDAGVTTLSGAIGGAGKLTKAGPGTLILGTAEAYTGGTEVSGGTLQLSGSLANSNITIDPSAVLQGGSGTLNYNIHDDMSDLITVLGTLDIGSLTLALNVTGSQSLLEYVVADYSAGGTIIGNSFAGVTGLPMGWSIVYNGTSLHPGAIVLQAPVPEPATLALVGLSVLGVIIRRRK